MRRTATRAGHGLATLAVTAALVVTYVPAAAAGSAPATVEPSRPHPVASVPGRPFVAPAAAPDRVAAGAAAPARVTWPAAGVAEVALPTAAARAAGSSVEPPAVDAGSSVELPAVRAGSLPVRVGAGDAPSEAPERIAVTVQDRAAARRAGADLLLTVRRTDGRPGRGRVRVMVDYSAFRGAYGGDWASRLALWPAGGGPAVAGRNDVRAGTVSGDVSVDATGTTYALAAAPAGSTGDYRATSLAASGTWQVATQGGAFSWSYPMRVPPVPGDLAPDVSATYSSSAVDGRVVAANSQPSWLGEGWNLWPGYIERSYRGCLDDLGGNNGSTKTGDLCWETDNATMSFGDHSGRLVLSGGVWRPENDDGTRIEHLTRSDPSANGDNDGEYWRVTTPDGTQYYFGLNRLPGWTAGRPVTESAWTVPVYGNDAGEPCHQATYAASACTQAYRWNLDHVVDPHGNSMSYFYTPESNRYGRNLGADVVSYVRGGTLARIEYGTRSGSEYAGPVPARVVFGVDDRCVAGQNCATHTAAVWPDVPWDTHCAGATCPGQVSPTFWSTKRLATVTTQVATGGGAYRDVDRWTFAQSYPAPGDGTTAGLWLASITRTGLAGTAVTLPAVTFDATMLPNRVNSAADGLPALNKPRVTRITTESGGATNVNYAAPDCAPGTRPEADTNTKRCYPVRWTMPPAPTPVDDWFHKYVVSTVVEDDLVTDAKDIVTHYDYVGGGGWAYDDNPILDPARRTWSEWRGYEKVVVRRGDPANDGNKPESRTQYLYFRGLNGDRLAGGGTKTVTVTDSAGVPMADRRPLAGFLREQITYDGSAEVTGEINDPWIRQTGAQGGYTSDQVESVRTATRTRLSGGTYRRTQVDTAYDAYGNPTQVDDGGDVAVTGDEECTRTTYVVNTAALLADRPSQVRKAGVACAATPSYPGDAISDTRYSYDGAAFGVAPTAGDVTKAEEAKAYAGSTPSYVVAETATYDAFGRGLVRRDALARPTTTAYTDANGLTTAETVTNALGHVTTTTLDPAWGAAVKETDPNGRITSLAYDALGRLSTAYKPGRSAAAGDGPNLRYSYGVRRSGGPNWTRTETLKANGNLVSTYELLDGFGRLRQTQAPSPAGGRVLTDKLYDSRGLESVARDQYYNASAAGTTLFVPDAGAVPSATVTAYDGAERPTARLHVERNAERWRTTTAYGGDHVDVVPPTGGTVTTTYTDPRDRITRLLQWHGRTPTGEADVTSYGYTKRGDLASATDAAGNVWRYAYDVRGHRVSADDPDAGVSTMTVDDAGQELTRTDARGKTVASVYDALGRVTERRLGSATGPMLTETEYDTLSKGAPTSSTRYVGGQPYKRATTGFDAAGRATGEAVTIPATEGALAGTYTTTYAYAADGSLLTKGLSALGNLPAETLTYGYDDLGLPDTLRGTFAYVTDTEYTALGEEAQRELGPTGKRLWRTTYYEDGTRRVTESLTERELPSGIMADDRTFGYDPAGNVTRITNRAAGSTADTQCVAYDHLARIVTAWTQTDACAAAPSAAVVGGPAPYWQEFSYDATGNRRQLTVKGVGGAADAVTTYAYPDPGDGVDRPHAVTRTTTGSATASYGYDASGSTTSRPGPSGDQTLTWDDAGLLATVTSGPATTAYVYDAAGTQLLRRDPDAVTLFLGDGEIRLDTATGARTGTRYYDGIGTRTSGGFTWTVSDRHGTAEVAISATTLAVTQRRFDLFGNPRGTAPTWPAGDRGFVGGTANETTGLTRLGAREYDTALGRFVSVDPVVDPTDPQQLNAYAYANNSPATMTDPDGLRYFEGDSGGWQESHAQPRPKPKSAAPVRSIARFRDFGRSSTGSTRLCRIPYPCGRGATLGLMDCSWVPGLQLCNPRARHVDRGRSAPKPSRYRQRLYITDTYADPDPRGSFSICPGVSGGLHVGAGAEACVSLDSRGMTVNASAKAFTNNGLTLGGLLGFKLSDASADNINNGSSSYVTGGGAVQGVGVGGTVESNGQRSLDISVGKVKGNADVEVGQNWGINSGYLPWFWGPSYVADLGPDPLTQLIYEQQHGPSRPPMV